MLTERLNQRQAEKSELESQLAVENNKKISLSEAQILAFLDYVCEMPLDDFNKRQAIINIFVHSVYLYDDRFTLIINASNCQFFCCCNRDKAFDSFLELFYPPYSKALYDHLPFLQIQSALYILGKFHFVYCMLRVYLFFKSP